MFGMFNAVKLHKNSNSNFSASAGKKKLYKAVAKTKQPPDHQSYTSLYFIFITDHNKSNVECKCETS